MFSTDATQFKAFISYSHKNRKTAEWLQKAIESYRVPKGLVNRATENGKIPSRLNPVFIDRQDLPASASLTSAVREILRQSEFLIVVCSPEAVASRWVNEEIIEFKRANGEPNVLCVIVDGEPFATSVDGQEDVECFPEPLRHCVDSDGTITHEIVEPVAADLRKGSDGRRMVLLKIIAGLLGVPLDELVHRDAHRRHQRLLGLSSALVVGMLTMSLLAFIAIEARNDAFAAREELERRHAQAEDLIEFMLVDLKEKLGSGENLAVMDAVGRQALGYYAGIPVRDLDGDSLGRRARTLQLLGEIQRLRGDLGSAKKALQESYQTTAELLARSPQNSDRIFEHAQSTFWIGQMAFREGDLMYAETAMQDYLDLAKQLVSIDERNTSWVAEVGHGYNNLGVIILKKGKWEQAASQFVLATQVFVQLTKEDSTNLEWQFALGQSLSWHSTSLGQMGQRDEARRTRQKELEIYHRIAQEFPENRIAKERELITHRIMARLWQDSGNSNAATNELLLAAKLGNKLTQEDPENAFWSRLAGKVFLDNAQILITQGRLLEAEQYLDQAGYIAQSLSASGKSGLNLQVEMECRLLIARAKLKYEMNDYLAGLKHISVALDRLSTLKAKHPKNDSINNRLAIANLVAGQLYEADGRSYQAQSHLRKTIDLLAESGFDLTPRRLTYIAEAKFGLGKLNEAEKEVAALEQSGYRHPDLIALKELLESL